VSDLNGGNFHFNCISRDKKMQLGTFCNQENIQKSNNLMVADGVCFFVSCRSNMLKRIQDRDKINFYSDVSPKHILKPDRREKKV
jgi:hypothetical protein